MARVCFTVQRDLPLPAKVVFERLIDWPGHADWVPLTRMRVLSGSGGPGTEFIATTGIGPLALPDRMRVDELDAESMTVRITKLGPVLTGPVHLSVTATSATASRVLWVEDVRVPGLPSLLTKPVATAAVHGFQRSLTRLAALAGSGPG